MIATVLAILPRFRRQLPIWALLLIGSVASAQQVPSAPEIQGEAAFLMDFHSEKVLAAQAPDQELPPASLAKMMTLYTAFKAIEDGQAALDDTVRVSEKAWQTKGSRMFLEVGDEVPLKRIIKGVIVESGNDACIALAEHIAGTEKAFVQLMNSHAEELGLDHTHFANATGLPAKGMHTTARDMGHLASALIREFPDHYPLFQIREMTYNDITQYNRNQLMWWDESVDGLKTGHTEAAGYSLTSSAERDGMRLIAVVLGTDSERARAEESQSLLNYGFRFYRTYRLYTAGEPLHKVRIWKGARDQVQVALRRDLYATIPRGQRDNIEITLDFREPLSAPVDKAAQIGTLTASLKGRELVSRPLATRKAVAQAGFFGRIADSVRMWLTE